MMAAAEEQKQQNIRDRRKLDSIIEQRVEKKAEEKVAGIRERYDALRIRHSSIFAFSIYFGIATTILRLIASKPAREASAAFFMGIVAIPVGAATVLKEWIEAQTDYGAGFWIKTVILVALVGFLFLVLIAAVVWFMLRITKHYADELTAFVVLTGLAVVVFLADNMILLPVSPGVLFLLILIAYVGARSFYDWEDEETKFNIKLVIFCVALFFFLMWGLGKLLTWA